MCRSFVAYARWSLLIAGLSLLTMVNCSGDDENSPLDSAAGAGGDGVGAVGGTRPSTGGSGTGGRSNDSGGQVSSGGRVSGNGGAPAGGVPPTGAAGQVVGTGGVSSAGAAGRDNANGGAPVGGVAGQAGSNGGTSQSGAAGQLSGIGGTSHAGAAGQLSGIGGTSLAGAAGQISGIGGTTVAGAAGQSNSAAGHAGSATQGGTAGQSGEEAYAGAAGGPTATNISCYVGGDYVLDPEVSALVSCPAGCGPSNPSQSVAVWGTDSYTIDSYICLAAIHAGTISTSGGTVIVTMTGERASFAGSLRNGVTTNSFGFPYNSFALSSP